jgi:beta-lactamase superfamily II metal-dependent hydrolase
VNATKRRAGRGGQSHRILVAFLAASLVALGLALLHRPDGATRITVLDVGQGDAILVEGSRGGRLLVDGGPDPERLLIALDERLPPWDRRLDAVILTHPHEDHVAGLALLLQRYKVGRVFEPGMIGPGPGYAAWASILAKGGPSRWALGTGDRLSVDTIDFRVLWPDPGQVPERPADGGTAINNVSIVLLGEVDGHRFLLAGDIEQAIDPQILARGIPQVDFLKVAHHGSATASTEPFLEAARPRVAVASAGAGNPYGHPAPSTMERLRAIAEHVYRTDLDGSVTVTFDGAAMRVHATGGRHIAGAPTVVTAVARIGGGSRSARRSVTLTTAAALAAQVATYSCGITAGSAPPARAPAVRSAGSAAATSAELAAALHLLHPPPRSGGLGTLLYHRADDGSVPLGGGPAAPVVRSPGLAPAAFARRRRDRGLARASGPTASRRQSRVGDRPLPRRDGRAPP